MKIIYLNTWGGRVTEPLKKFFESNQDVDVFCLQEVWHDASFSVMDKDEQSDLFAAADVVVMPSVSEPFGIIPLESMSSGTPVIMSKQSGVSEVVSHALKVDFWDTDAMADKILSIIRHPVLKQTLSQEGKRQVKDITWDKAAKKTSSIYTKTYTTTK